MSNENGVVNVDHPSLKVAAKCATSSPVMNPYRKSACGTKRKFVGGAEQARLQARKKSKGTPIMRPGQVERMNEVISEKMNPFERFFTAMLRSAPAEYAAAESNDAKALQLWKAICGRVSLSIPTERIRPVYDDPRLHFQVRAALVLEEARTVLSQGLGTKWNSKVKTNLPKMILKAFNSHSTKTQGNAKLFFKNFARFTNEELFHIRPGSVFECMPRAEMVSIHNVILGVVTSSNREQVEKKGVIEVMVFRDIPGGEKWIDDDWIVTPIASLVTEYRCFDAMSRNPSTISFLQSLLGTRKATHTRFEEEVVQSDPPGTKEEPVELDLEEENEVMSKTASVSPSPPPPGVDKQTIVFCDSDDSSDEQSSDTLSLPVSPREKQQPVFFKLPKLNSTQNKAAREFLESEQSSITLVQGPPGTGKTTLLVSVICQYLLEAGESKRRLMVCAPTNKAISVLASRFMAAVDHDNYPCNALIVGDGDKLLVDEKSAKNHRKQDVAEDVELSSIFIYSWKQCVSGEYRKIRNHFLPKSGSRQTPSVLHKAASRLDKRLRRSLPSLPQNLHTLSASITSKLESLKNGGSAPSIVATIDEFLKVFNQLEVDSIWRELVTTADVLFCTLASAGGSIFRNSPGIHDLIVDEAAAATEPELCIPLHLRPTRLLAVGDPLQLPATVISRRATELGLTKSLHERLMYECGYKHIMLDVQYRMNPEISLFPSFRFYDSKIMNGENVTCVNYKTGARLLDRNPYTFLHVEGREEQNFGGSYRNHAEAQAVAELLIKLRSLSQINRYHQGAKSPAWCSSDKVRVITFYQAQVALLKRTLESKGLGDVVVATVDSSQGCEADVVIVSFVRSVGKKPSLRASAGFLTDDRRMNVALTRARYQLICVGNVEGMKWIEGGEAETIRLLSSNAESRNLVRAFSAVHQAAPDDSKKIKRETAH